MQLTAATGAAPAHKDPPTAEKHTQRPVEPHHAAATAADTALFVGVVKQTKQCT